MAAVISSRGQTSELQSHYKRWKDRSETSPERNRVWTEPQPKLKESKKVPVVYYLSRNGQLEHPHFMEVPLSSPEGLYLRDVINRLNALRGKGMATMYSWSSKRSYRNGFVWHDLSENDFIYPAHGLEYVLKGSELHLDPVYDPKVLETASSRCLKPPPELQNRGGDEDDDFPAVVRRRNQSWSSIDLNEYKVYKAESFGESAGKAAADASTQTDDKRRRRRTAREDQEEEKEKVGEGEKSQREIYESQSTELGRDEISPPPSDSSPETLESLMKADGRLVLCANGENEEGPSQTAQNCPSGRTRASSVLMQLLSCGSVSFKDCGSTLVKSHGLSLIGHNKARLPRVVGNQVGATSERSNFAGVKLEDKEYFSGSLVETKKAAFPALQRSTSYNADRSSQLELAEHEEIGVRTKCIPRKQKAVPSKKESNILTTSCDNGSGIEGGSKRFDFHTQG